MERNSQQIVNYIKIANTYPKYRNIYFFLKNYAYNKMMSIKMPIEEEKSLKRQMEFFIKEMGNSGWDRKQMSKAEYTKFLDFHYDKVVNEAMDIDTVYICRDLLEVLTSFGKYDDISLQRLEYFNKKISKLSEPSTSLININEIADPQLKDLNQDITAIPTYVDKSIPPTALNQRLHEHLTSLTKELDSDNIEEAKNHIEAVIYYLRNSISNSNSNSNK